MQCQTSDSSATSRVRCTRQMHPPRSTLRIGHLGNGRADSNCFKDVHGCPQKILSVSRHQVRNLTILCDMHSRNWRCRCALNRRWRQTSGHTVLVRKTSFPSLSVEGMSRQGIPPSARRTPVRCTLEQGPVLQHLRHTHCTPRPCLCGPRQGQPSPCRWSGVPLCSPGSHTSKIPRQGKPNGRLESDNKSVNHSRYTTQRINIWRSHRHG